MAEFVEFRIEQTIPEVEEMERLGILSDKEVKKLIQKRRDFEYRLARRSKRKVDFINFITYEKKLIELIRIRRKQMNVFEKRHQIEAAISRRVLKQARLLTRMWPSHPDTWALRISFSRFVGWKDEIYSAYREQVNFHGNSESVWIAWAKWEVEERRNFEQARAILLSKAPLYHPKSQLIKRELFRLELLYVEMLINKVKHDNIAGLEEVIAENREKVLNCAVARAVYLDAVRTLPQPELYLQLYQVADKFEFAHQLREEIHRDLCVNFPGAECLWKLKVQRLIAGLGEAKTELLENTKNNENNAKGDDENIDTDMIVGTVISDADNGSQDKKIQNIIKRKETKKKITTEEDEDKEDNDDNDKVKDVNVEGEREEEEEEEEDSGVEDEELEGEEEEVEGEEEEVEGEEEEVEGEEEEVEGEEVEVEGEEEEVEGEEEEVEGEEEEVEGEEEEVEGEEEEEEDEMEQEEDNNIEKEEESIVKMEDEEEVEMDNDEEEEEDEVEQDDDNSENTDEEEEEEEEEDGQQEGAVVEVKQESFTPTDVLPATPADKLDPKGKLELFISIFDQAMEAVGGKFVTTYIDELLLLLHQCWGVSDLTSLIYTTLLKLFDQHSALLSPLHFYIWYRVLGEEEPGDKHKYKGRAVLECGVRQHPAASHLQLELARCIIREADTDAQVMKEFKKVGSSMQGECGLVAWEEYARHLCKDNNRTKVFKVALDHEDLTVARGMRLRYLHDVGLHEGIAAARKLYQKLKWRPPFCGRLQALMVELEMAQFTVKADAVREVFNISVQQQGATNPGMWLAYIHFEKKLGDPLKAGGLLTRAEKELEAQHAHIFRELNSTIQEIQNKGGAPVMSENNNRFFIEQTEDGEESQYKEEEETERQPSLVCLFEEDLTLAFTADTARTTFFSAIQAMERKMNKGNKQSPGDSGREWEKVLELLLGHKVILSIQEVKVEEDLTQQTEKPVQEKLIRPRFKKKYVPTDQLKPGEGKSVKTVNEDDIEKILATSEVLKPEFMQKTCLNPYFVSKKKAKELRKKESVKTKGPGWFNMKAPELTEEAKRDLEVLQMRSILDPKRHYKNDMKILPKYFQLAEVVDSPIDFYSSRVPKKKRKRTMAEEVMHDEEALRYQKKKYTEIIAARQKKQFKHPHILKKKKTKTISKKK